MSKNTHHPPAPRPLSPAQRRGLRTATNAGSHDQLSEAAAGTPVQRLEQHRRSREIHEEHARHRDRLNELYAAPSADVEQAARPVDREPVAAEAPESPEQANKADKKE